MAENSKKLSGVHTAVSVNARADPKFGGSEERRDRVKRIIVATRLGRLQFWTTRLRNGENWTKDSCVWLYEMEGEFNFND